MSKWFDCFWVTKHVCSLLTFDVARFWGNGEGIGTTFLQENNLCMNDIQLTKASRWSAGSLSLIVHQPFYMVCNHKAQKPETPDLKSEDHNCFVVSKPPSHSLTDSIFCNCFYILSALFIYWFYFDWVFLIHSLLIMTILAKVIIYIDSHVYVYWFIM